MASQAKNVLLAAKWDDSIDPTGYFMSEKMDGVRAYWSGSNFYSRSGNEFFAPKWFTADLPKTPLDGELWCGRGLFQRCVGIVKTKKTEHPDWKFVTYLIFDAPSHGGKFEERYKWLQENIDSTKATTYATVVGHERCENKDHLITQLDKVLAMGGEGLMLRQAGSKYQGGRNKTLLKVKVFHDEEALVLGHEKGTGRLQNLMGKIRCKLANGIEFKIGTGFSDAQRKSPPKIGSVVTFKYQETSESGNPRFPVFLRERGDVTWAEVLENAKSVQPHSEMAKKKFVLKKRHTLLYTTVPSREQSTGEKIVTDDDVVDPPINPPAKTEKLPPCRYGAACYQQNETHLSHFSHPERPKKEEEEKKKTSTAATAKKRAKPASAEVVPCRWGKQCFRTAADHRSKYSHEHEPEEIKLDKPAGAKKSKEEKSAHVDEDVEKEFSEEADVPEEELERHATAGITRGDIQVALTKQKTLLLGKIAEDEADVVISAAELKRLREMASKYESLSTK